MTINPTPWALTALVLLTPVGLAQAPPKPGKPVEYKGLAMFPDRWAMAKTSTQLVPWQGKQVVFLTTNPDFDPKVMAIFLSRFDAGWKLYADLVGKAPNPFRAVNGKPTIAAVPDAALTCGMGCGYVGSTGIEVAGFYAGDYDVVKKDAQAFPHYYFYEMGRNYFVFGDRHSLFTTGYAVFMRYVCMDALKCIDPDAKTRKTIEECEERYAKSDVKFLDAFTNLGAGEKGNRLKDADGKEVVPSDQPVMYATAMLKLRKDNGGDAWVKRYCAALLKCPEVNATDIEARALRQAMNWVVCASVAAKKDMTPVFADRWRMPLGPQTKAALNKVSWSTAPEPAIVLSKLPEDPRK
jgi:hypothetical protein